MIQKQSPAAPVAGPSSLALQKSQRRAVEKENDDDDDEDEQGPMPPPPNKDQNGDFQEPEFEASGDEEDEDDSPQFPITHEVTLKDHTKVVSALALDPSGARIVSGSHDYDCKLWDFGGMDMRCKPFKSWEPAGTYYVCMHVIPSFHFVHSSFHSRRSYLYLALPFLGPRPQVF